MSESTPTGTARPDFLIVGAMRSGSSTLNRYLGDHRGVFMAEGKEIHYFDKLYRLGSDWYAAHFRDAPEGSLRGEATPSYFSDPEAMRRIAADLPGVRCLLVLRHPVDRLYSHYWMSVRREVEARPFARVVAEDLHKQPEPLMFSQSRYARHLALMFELFPAERCLVLSLDDLERRPEQVFRTACGFLGLDPEPIPQSVGVVVNKGFEVRSQRLRRWTKARWVPKRVQNLVARLNQPPLEYPEMDAGVRRQLNEAFRADIEAAAIAVQRTRAPAVNPSTPGSTSTV